MNGLTELRYRHERIKKEVFYLYPSVSTRKLNTTSGGSGICQILISAYSDRIETVGAGFSEVISHRPWSNKGPVNVLRSILLI
jgi:hypothetical protein